MDKKKPMCKYGAKCYRRNPQHLKDYDHPKEEEKSAEEKRGHGLREEQESEKQTHGSPGKKTPADTGALKKVAPAKEAKAESPSTIKGTDDAPSRKRTSSDQKGGDSKKRRVPSESEDSESGSDNEDRPAIEEEDILSEPGAEKVPTVVLQEDDEVMSSDGGEEEAEIDGHGEDTSKNGKTKVGYGPAESADKLSTADDGENGEQKEENDLVDFADGVDMKAVQKAFLVRMPKEFHQFWEFAKAVNAKNPEEALMCAHLRLVGPFDVLGGKFQGKKLEQDRVLRHWRYYYDPPEFQTLIADVSKDSGYHIGYWRDAPGENPVWVVENNANDSKNAAKFVPIGANIFQAVYTRLNEAADKGSTFEKPKLQKLIKAVKNFAKEHEVALDADYPKRPSSRQGSVANPFHGMGMVVPFDKKRDVGYRPIPETQPALKKMFQRLVSSSLESRDKAMEPIDELVTNVQFANDEGDPGMGLELGLDMFSFGGSPLHGVCENLLTVAYTLLGRQAFGTILKAHLQDRRTGNNLSILEESLGSSPHV